MSCLDDHTRETRWKLCAVCGMTDDYSLLRADDPLSVCKDCREKAYVRREREEKMQSVPETDDKGRQLVKSQSV